MTVFKPNLNTNQANLASEAPARKVMVGYMNGIIEFPTGGLTYLLRVRLPTGAHAPLLLPTIGPSPIIPIIVMS